MAPVRRGGLLRPRPQLPGAAVTVSGNGRVAPRSAWRHPA